MTTSKTTAKAKKSRKPLIMALEPRVLLDGAALATGAEMLTDLDYKNKIVQDEANKIAPTMPDAAIAPTQVRAVDPTQNNGKKEVTFIDTNLENYKVLVEGIGSGIEVQLIDGSKDGLAQINTWAQTHTGYDAIHILSHGSSGDIHLGTTSLTDANLSQHSTELTNIGNSLTANGDILVYGCDVAAGQTGMDLIGKLAQATNADIAASDDLTGASDKGGDWVLEVNFGDVEQTALMIDGFNSVLGNTPADETFTSSSFTDNTASSITINGIVYTSNGDAIPDIYDYERDMGESTRGFSGHGIFSTNVLTDTSSSRTTFSFATSDSSDFKLNSLSATAYYERGTIFTITGYSGGTGGTKVVEVTDFNFAESGTYGTGNAVIAYSDNTETYNAGRISFGSDWDNIDTVVFTLTGGNSFNNGLIIGLDNIDFSDPTPDTTAPTIDVLKSSPVDNNLGVGEYRDIIIDFSENIAFGSSGLISLKDITNGTTVETFNTATASNGVVTGSLDSTATIANDKLTINPKNNLAQGTQYSVVFDGGSIKDTAGNAIAAINDTSVYNFKTQGATPAYPGKTIGEARNEKAFAAIRQDGSVVAWGDADYGGKIPDDKKTALSSGVVQIFSTGSAFAALKADGSVVTWGLNGGNSSGKDLSSGVVQIFSTGSAFAALKAEGSVVTWGTNGGYSLGKDLSSGVVQIFSTNDAFAALKADGSVVTWGANGGDSSGKNLSNVVQVFSTASAFAALKADGSVVTWGNASSGGEAIGTTTSVSHVADNALNSGVVQVFSTNDAFAALKADGSVVTWGNSSAGGFTLGNNSNVVQVFSTKDSFAVLKSDGSVESWGQIAGSATDVVQVFSTNSAFAVLKADGSVVTWGNPSNGGNIPDYKKTALSNGVVQVFSTTGAFAALKADGSVVTWGNASSGGEAIGTTTSVSHVAEGALDSGVVQVFSTGTAFAALKEDGSVVTWGNEETGGSSSSVTVITTLDFGGTTKDIQFSSVADQLKDPTNKVLAINDIYTNYNVKLGPMAKLSAGKTSLNLADTSTTVSITLSDPVDGFSFSDITVTGGTLTNFTGSGQNYTATFTPQANFKGDAVISIAKNSFTATADGKPNIVASMLNIAVDTTPPSNTGVAIANDKLVLSFTQPLDTAHPPLASAFTVTSGDQTIAVTNVAVSGQQVTLTLATPPSQLASLSVSYKDPTSGDDASAIQDTLGQDASSVATQTFNNTAPTLTLAMQGAVNTRPTYTEGDANPVAIFGTAQGTYLVSSLADTDDTQLSGMKVQIDKGFTSGDVLGYTLPASSGITANYNAQTGLLTLSGVSSLANYKTALSSLTFSNTGDAPTANGNSRTINVTVTDNGGAGLAAKESVFNSLSNSLFIFVKGVNDSAPTLDPSKSPEMTGLLKVTAPVNGVLPAKGVTNIADLIGYTGISNVTDVDKDIPGIAITGLTNEGSMYYTTDAGTTWKQMTISTTATDTGIRANNALLLKADGKTFIYYVPTATEEKTIDNAITFRAWDGSQGTNGGSLSIVPTLTEQLNKTGNTNNLATSAADEVFVEGNRAYVSDGSGGLKVFDITDPAKPVPLTAKTLAKIPNGWYGSTNDTFVNGSYAYVVDDKTLRIVQLSGNTSADTLKSTTTIATVDTVHSVTLVGNMLYIADGSVGIQAIDVSNPASPVVKVGYYDTQGTAWDVEVKQINGKTYAFIADGTKGLAVVDVDITTWPTSGKITLGTATGSYTPLSLGGGTAYRLTIDGNYAYIADDNLGLKIVDISTPLNPKVVGTYKHATGVAWDVKVSNGIAYLANSTGGLVLVDVADPTKPTLLTSATKATGAANFNSSGVAIQGDYAYIADSANGLRVVKISDLGMGTSTTVGSISDQYDTVKLNIKNNTAPVLTDATPSLPSVHTQTGTPTNGDTTGSISIYELLGGNATDKNTPKFSDADGDSAGIAITGVKSGTLYYSIDNGSTWNKMSGLSETSAQVFMVNDQTRFYFDPNATVGTVADAVTFKAWDGSGGFSNAKTGVDTTTSPTNSFSTTSEQVSVVIDPFNTAPSFFVAGFNSLITSTSLTYNQSNSVGTPLAPNAKIYDDQLGTTGNYSNTTLTLQRADGVNVNDVFVATGTTKLFENDNIYGDVLTTNNEGGIDHNISVIGTYTQVAGKLVMSFNATTVTRDQINAVMQSIGYTNVGNRSETVNIAWTFNDGNTGSQGINGAKETTALSTPIEVIVSLPNTAPVFGPGTVLGVGNMSLNIPASLVDTSRNVLMSSPDFPVILGDVNPITGANGQTEVQVTYATLLESIMPSVPVGATGKPEYLFSNVFNPTAGNDVPVVLKEVGYVAYNTVPLTNLFVGGYTDVNGDKDFELLKISLPYSRDGLVMDTSFGNQGVVVLPFSSRDDEVTSLTPYTDSTTTDTKTKVMVAGTTVTANGDKDIVLVRLNSDGSLDSSFGEGGKVQITNTSGNDYINNIQEDKQGNIFVWGSIANSSGQSVATLMKYSVAGALDTSFGENGKVQMSSLGVSSGVALTSYTFPDVDATEEGVYPQFIQSLSSKTVWLVSGNKQLNDGKSVPFAAIIDVNGKILGNPVEVPNLAGSAYAGAIDKPMGFFSFERSYQTLYFSMTVTSNSDTGQLVGKLATLAVTIAGNANDGWSFNWETPTSTSVLPVTDIKSIPNVGGFVPAEFASLTTGDGSGLQVTLDANGNLLMQNLAVYRIGNDPVKLDSALTVSDAELRTSFNGATITIEREGGANADDVFGLPMGSTEGMYSIVSPSLGSSLNVKNGGNSYPIGSMSSSNGKLTIMGSFGLGQKEMNQLLQSLTYQNTNTNLTAEETIKVNITVNDGNTGSQGSGGSKSATHTYTVKLTPAAAPNDATSTLTAGTITTPVTLATTKATLADAVNVLDFNIADIASSTDDVPTTIERISIDVSGTADPSQVKWVLMGPSVPEGLIGSYDAATQKVIFDMTAVTISVKNQAENYTVSAYLNEFAKVNDGQTLILSLPTTGLTTNRSGSTFASSQPAVTNTVTVDVIASRLLFKASNNGNVIHGVSGQLLSSQPIVLAVDQWGNVDKDFTGSVTLSDTGAGELSSMDSLTVTATAGVASFSGVKYLAHDDASGYGFGEGFYLVATAEGADAEEFEEREAVSTNYFRADVKATKLVFAEQVITTSIASGVESTLAGRWVIQAVDADGKVDVDFTGSTATANIYITDPTDSIRDGVVNSFTADGMQDMTQMMGFYYKEFTNGQLVLDNAKMKFTSSAATANIGLKIITSPFVSGSGVTPEIVSNGFTVTKENHAPTLTLAQSTVNFTEVNNAIGYAGISIADGVILSDADQTKLSSMTVKLVNPQAGDVLYIDRDSISGFLVDGFFTNEIKVSGNWNSVDAYQSLLRDFKFYNESDTPDTTPREIQITLDDGQSANNLRTQTLTVNVTPTNDLPTATGSLSLFVNEDETSSLNFSYVSLRDPDIGTSNLTVTIKVTAGSLLAESGAGVEVSHSGTSELTLVGAKNALNAYLQSSPSLINYKSVLNANGVARLTLSVADEDNNPQYLPLSNGADEYVFDLIINSVNDAPVLSDVPTSVTNVLVGAAEALDNFTVTDVDSTSLTLTLTATNGTIGGVTDADVNTEGTQLTGTVAEINAALANATFTATADGNAGIAIDVTDHEGGTATANYAFKATTPNTSPTLSTLENQSVTTGVKASISGIQVTDPDTIDRLTMTLTPTGAQITDLWDMDSTIAGIQITGSAADINAKLANAKILVSANGNASIAVSVTDNVNGTTPDTETYTFTATNAIPTLTLVSTLAEGSEDRAYSLTFAGLSRAADEADSNGSVDAFVVKAVSTGTLTINGNAWVAGTNDVINPDSLVVWTPTANANGELDAFTIVAKDNLGAESATPIQVKVAVSAVNDAPTLSGSDYTFMGINEKGTTTGVKVSTILGTMTVSDVETATANMGIAITSSPTTYGQWQVSTDSTNGTNGTWSNIGTTSASVAQLLSKDTYIRFKAEGELSSNETVSFGYVAWDGGVGTAGGTADTTASTAFSTTSQTASVALTAVDDPFSLTLSNGKATASYTENAQYVLDADLVLADPDTATNLAGSSVSINAGFNSAQDRLKINGTENGTFTSSTSQAITYAYNTTTGVMTLTGTASQASYQEALRAVQYVNNSENPDTTARSIEVTAGTMLAWRDTNNVVHFYEYIKADGTAGYPRLQWTDAKNAAAAKNYAGYQGYLTTVTSSAENEFLKTKLPGSSWLGGTDETTEGTWKWVTGPEAGTEFYQVDYGLLGVITGGHALNSSYINWGSVPNNYFNEDYLTVMPNGTGEWNDLANPNFNGYEINGYLVEYTSPVGAEIAFSKTITLTPVAQNDAPVMTLATPPLTNITEDATTNNGSLISALLGASVTDADTGAVEGIAITSLSSLGNGEWQYKTASGSWTAIGAVSETQALVLKDTASIRFNSDGKNGDTASFTYRAWDQTTGTEGSKVDASSTGDITAFSTRENTASITITAVNDAPVFAENTAMKLSAISENLALADNAGQTVASFLSGLSDVDVNASQGIAITGLTTVGTGKWQYKVGSGNWTELTEASESAARLLRATDLIRFAPDALNGGTPTLTVRGWDTTSGTAGNTANITTSGGTTAYSAVTASIAIEVKAINDAPVLSMASTALAYTENASSGTVLDSALTIVDDSVSLSKAVISIREGFNAGDQLTFVDTSAITGNYDANTGNLILTSSTASVAQWQTALRSITFSSTSDDPTVNRATRTLSISILDAEDEKSNVVSRDVTITAVNDAPIVTSSNSFTYTEDDGSRVIDAGLSLVDNDDIQLASATVTLNPSSTGFDATKEGLGLAKASLMVMSGNDWTASNINDTGINASYTAATGVLILTGNASVLDYQDIMRSITYTNTQDYPLPSSLTSKDSRSVTWTVTDANSDGAGSANAVTKTTAITLKDANEAPKVSGANNPVVSYTENATAQTLAINLTAQDDDTDGNITGATVKIVQGFTQGDTLAFTNQNGITGNYDATTGILTLSGSSSVAHYQEAMRGITFSNTGDDPTSTSATRSVIWQVKDATGTPSAVTADTTTTVNVTAVNDQAVVTLLPSTTLALTEGDVNVRLASGIILDDADNNRLSSATIALGTGFDGAKETLVLDGKTVTSGSASAGNNWTISDVNNTGISASFDNTTGVLTLSGTQDIQAYQQIMRLVSYSNNSADPTASGNSRAINWTVTDADNLASTQVSTTVNLTAINNAATLTGLSGSALAFTEGTPLTLGSGITLADADDTQLSSAKVWISQGFTQGDTLSITAGSLTHNYDTQTGELTLSGTGSLADYQSALRSVQFSSGDDPTSISATRQISWTVTDANSDGVGAATSDLAVVKVNVTAINDAAVITANAAVTFTEDSEPVVIDDALTIADADDSQLTGATVTISTGLTTGDTLSFTAMKGITGSYNSGTGVLTLTGTASVAGYQEMLRSVKFVNTSAEPNNNGTATSRGITWAVTDANSDGVGAATGTDTSSLTVTAINATPIMTAGSALSYTENAAPTVIDSNITLTDADDTQMAGATVTMSSGLTDGDSLGFTNQNGITGSYANGVLTLTGTATKADYQTALRSVTFQNTGEDATATSSSRTIAWAVTDANSDLAGAQTSTAVTSSITVTALADAPVITGNPSSALSYTEGNDPLAIAPNLVLTDADDTQLSSASVRITANLLASDKLQAVTTGTSIVASYDQDTGVLLLIGTDTVANYQTVMRSVVFSNNSADPTAAGSKATRTFSWSVTDANSDNVGTQISNAVTSNTTVMGVNAKSVMNAQETNTAYTENDPETKVNTFVTLEDVDSTHITGASVSITTGLTTGDTLHFTNTNAITGSYNATTGVLTLTGEASIADYQTALRSVTFSTTNDNPTANSTTRTVSWTVTDKDAGGTNHALSTASTSQITITPLNDIPTLTAMSGVVTTATEDTQHAITLADLLAQGNEADADGSVTGFIVKSVTSGTLKIGADAQTATLFNATTNNLIDATHQAFWTANANVNGSSLEAFKVVAQDNLGSVSETPVAVNLAVTAVADQAAVTSVKMPINGLYGIGNNMDFVVNFDKSVTINNTNGIPSIDVTLATGGTVKAEYLSGSGTDKLTFRYVVESGKEDSDGINVANSISLNGATITNMDDGQTVNAVLDLGSLASTESVLVDGIAPTVSSISPTGATNASSVTYTVTLNNDVTGLDKNDFVLDRTGSAKGSISTVTGSGNTYSVTVDNISGTGTIGLNLRASGTGIIDIANNAIASGFTGTTHAVDRDAPVLTIDQISSDGYVNAREANSTVTISGQATGAEDGRAVTVTLGNVTKTAQVANGAWSVDVLSTDWSQLTEGNLTVTANVSDTAGNTATQAERSMTYDTTAPIIHINALTTDNTVNSAEANTGVTLTGTATGAEDGQEIILTIGDTSKSATVTNGAWSVNMTQQALSTIEQGEVGISALVLDKAGNLGKQSGSFILDTQAPTIAINTIADDNFINDAEDESSLVISGTTTGVENGQQVTLSFAGISKQAIVSDHGWTVSLTSTEVKDLSEGDLTITADVQDTAGNSAAQATSSVTYDKTAPIVILDDVTGDDKINAREYQEGFYLTGTANTDGVATVSINDQLLTTMVSDGVWKVWVAPSAYLATSDTQIQMDVVIKDAAGNTSKSISRMIEMDAIAPEQLGISLRSDTGESKTDTITSLNPLNLSQKEYGAVVQYSYNGGSLWTSDYQVQEGNNSVMVRQVDAMGNASQATNVFTFTQDKTRPRIVSDITGAVEEESHVNAVIYQVAAHDSNVLSYSIRPDIDDGYLVNIDAQTGEVRLNQSADYESNQRQYQFVIVATDKAGNTSEHHVSVQVENKIGLNNTVKIKDQLVFASLFNKDMSELFDDIDVSDIQSFSIEGLPKGLTYDTKTGVISGQVSDIGVFRINVTVTDHTGKTATNTFLLDIAGPSTPLMPPLEGAKTTRTNHEIMIDRTTIMVNKNDASIIPTTISQLTKADTSSANIGLFTSASSRLFIDTTSIEAKTTLSSQVQVTVGSNGVVKFNIAQQPSFQINGLAVDRIHKEGENLQVFITDAKPAQNYSATMPDGSPLPEGITINAQTGTITVKPQVGQKELTVKVNALGKDGVMRILEVKVKLDDSNKEKPQVFFKDNLTFRQQVDIAYNDHYGKNYGDRLIAALMG